MIMLIIIILFGNLVLIEESKKRENFMTGIFYEYSKHLQIFNCQASRERLKLFVVLLNI